MPEVFASPVGSCTIRSGFCTLPSGAEVSELPLYDAKNELFARLSLAEARQWCEANGYRLPTVAELRELHNASLYIAPVTLPTAAMVTAAGLPLTTAAINKFRNENMASKAWARIHDDTVDRELEKAGYDGSEPVANVGKCWTQDGYLFGWKKLDGSYIQNPYSGHGLHHHDYASTTYVARVDMPPPADTEPSPPIAGMDLGDAVLEAARADLAKGVGEDLGRNDGKRIREYLKPFGLNPPQNWCSVAVAAWLREACERYGIEQPIKGSPGAQATMVQLRKAGLWVDKGKLSDDDLQPGNIVVWRRPGGPAWWGHIGVIAEHHPGSATFATIEGNSGPLGDRVALVMTRKLNDPLLLGVGRLDGYQAATEPVSVTLPDDEPVHDGSDPIQVDAEQLADHLFARWLGLDVLADPAGHIEPDDGSCTGLDISSWQAPSSLDWDAIASAHEFVICRVTYGNKSDATWLQHAQAVSHAGLALGSYHFVRTSQPWAAQLDAFCKQLEAAGYGAADLLPALDLEKNEPYDSWQPSKLLAYAQSMAEVLTARFGGCMLYTSPSVAAEMGHPELLRQHPIWVAHYGVSEPRWPADNPWTVWQSSGSHQGPEATGPLDFNHARSLPRCE